MHTETLQCIVLSTLDYGDNDRIASLFSLEHGKIKGFARSARKSRKRFGAALESFARIDVQVRLKEGLCSLQQAGIRNIYPQIRSNLDCIALALYACELTDAITPEGVPLPRLFRLFSAYLDRMDSAGASEQDRRFFEINLLNILGYRPTLEECASCGTIFGNSGAVMAACGQLSCRNCRDSGAVISHATIRFLQGCLRTGTFGLLAADAESLSQAGSLLDAAIAHHTGRQMKSADFLRQLSDHGNIRT